MKRICIVSYSNLFILPYAKGYVEHIRNNGDQCFLLYWNRDVSGNVNDLRNYPDCNHFTFDEQHPIDNGNPFIKFLDYIKVTNYFINTLKKQRFDGLIFLQTHAAIACNRILTKYYSQKYIVDVRDYTQENIALYRYIEKKVFKNAYGVVISSPAYKQFLPVMNYTLAHNFSAFPKAMMKDLRLNYPSEMPITISFVGTVRFYDMDKQILAKFRNDHRFKICYYGTGSDYLKRYAKDNSIDNVEFVGSFQSSETIDFYRQTSLINNLYGNHNRFLDYALSNKIYHAAQLYRPILVCPDTYMEEITKEYNLGLVFDVTDEGAVEKLFTQFQTFDWDKFKQGCESFIDRVINDNKGYDRLCISFLENC